MSYSDLFSNSIHAQWSIFFWYVIPLIKFHHSHLIMQCTSCSAKPLLFLSVTWKLCCICGPGRRQCSSQPVPGNALGHMDGIHYVQFSLPVLLLLLAGEECFLTFLNGYHFVSASLLNTNAKKHICATWNRSEEARVRPKNSVWILSSASG